MRTAEGRNRTHFPLQRSATASLQLNMAQLPSTGSQIHLARWLHLASARHKDGNSLLVTASRSARRSHRLVAEILHPDCSEKEDPSTGPATHSLRINGFSIWRLVPLPKFPCHCQPQKQPQRATFWCGVRRLSRDLDLDDIEPRNELNTQLRL